MNGSESSLTIGLMNALMTPNSRATNTIVEELVRPRAVALAEVHAR